MRLDPLYYAHPLSGAVMPVTTDLLAETYLAPKQADWTLLPALTDPDAPWAASLLVAPDTVVAAVGHALRGLMQAVPGLDPANLHPEALPNSRARRHLMALKDVWQHAGLPPDLAVLRHVLTSQATDALSPLPPLPTSDPFATAADTSLQATLLAHHGPAPQTALQSHLARRPQGATQGSLAHIQSGLLNPTNRDNTLSFFALRDSLQEARFAAALARQMLQDGRAQTPSDIAILLPDDPMRQSHLAEAFDAQGLALSGLSDAPQRDIGGELALLALQVLQSPAPAMALASLVMLPCMPWSPATGAALARDLMQGRYAPRLVERLTGQGAILWQTLQDGASTGKQLSYKLGVLADSLTGPNSDTAPLRHLQSMTGDEAPDWPALLQAARPNPAQTPAPHRLLHGITLLNAADLPWRGARHLIVTGFAAGEYPRAAANSPFFLDSERALIRAELGLTLPGQGDALSRGLALFARQIGAASDSVTFLSPRMDGAGKPLALPLTFSLLAATLQGEQGLLQDITAMPTAQWPVAHTPIVTAPPPPEPPATISLNRDLLRLNQNAAGLALPQSPSRLETLIVSPLAWALAEMGAVDVPWEPDSLTVMLKGTLAHHVLEHSFPPGPLPDAAQLDAQAAQHYADAIRQHAPFLAAAQWQLERETLLRETQRAVRLWHDILTAEGAETLLNEVRLHGEAHGIFIKGRADAVLRLGDGQILIVDHKKSGSNGRRARMKAGWDLQIALYRAMLLRPIRAEGDGLDPVMGQTPAIAYHTLNDATLLQSGLRARNQGSPRVELVPGDISGNALQRMVENLAQVAAGNITLNTTADQAFFEKQAHLTPYAFDASPLIRRFMVQADEDTE